MKKIFSIILAAVAIVEFSPVLKAQSWKYTDNGNGVAYKKTISEPNDDGIYTITLESFVTGAVTIEQTSIPADIVLVLDYSYSMRNNMTEVTYTPRAEADYNGNRASWNNVSYYYLYDGHYYLVNRVHEGNYYRLYFDAGSTRWYLTHTGNGANITYTITDTPPTNVTNTSDVIWHGVLYDEHTENKGRKIDALQESVVSFVKKIQANNESLGLPQGQTGNRIALVLYSETQNIQRTGLNELIDVTSFTFNQNDPKQLLYGTTNVLEFTEHHGTNSEGGMAGAKDILDPHKTETDRSRAVVMFTDGSPTSYHIDQQQGFSTSVANGCISNAYYIKNTIKAPVYTIGLFEESDKTDQVKTYMEYTSSDFPDKSAMPTSSSDYLDFDEDYGDYCMIVSEEMNLDDIFQKISQETGGSGNTSMSSAVTAVDVVSASFVLPGAEDDDTTDEEILENVKVYIVPCTGQRDETYTVTQKNPETGQDEEVTKHYLTFDDPSAENQVDFTADDSEIEVTLEAKNGTKRNAISINGFDYSENWCGPQEDITTHNISWHGYKVVITIDIEMDPDATGGPNVETNGPGSGLYTMIDGVLTNVLKFDSPTVSLPVNLHINKQGLKKGESAKFLIQRALLPDNWVTPATETDDAYKNLTWEDVTSVFVTQHEGDAANAALTKVVGLPSTKSVQKTVDGVLKTVQVPFVYRVIEERWSWSYSSTALTPTYTDHLVTNPIQFQNTKKGSGNIDYKVRNAESKATNIFKTMGEGEENVLYDDSKTNVRNKNTSSEEPESPGGNL